MTTFKKNISRLALALVLITVAGLMLCFSLDILQYGGYSLSLRSLENQAEAGTWTSEGFVHWTQSLIDKYNQGIENRDAFVSSNDVGSFLYHSAFSDLGRILRALTVIVVLTVFVVSQILAVYLFILVIKSLTKTPKKAQRPYRR